VGRAGWPESPRRPVPEVLSCPTRPPRQRKLVLGFVLGAAGFPALLGGTVQLPEETATAAVYSSYCLPL